MTKCIVFAPHDCEIGFLYPFAFTRRVQDFRVGALTIREKWECLLEMPSLDLEDDRYSTFFPATNLQNIGDDVIKYIIPGNLLPTKDLVEKIKELNPGEAITNGDNKALINCIAKPGTLGDVKRVCRIENDKLPLLDFFLKINHLNKEALQYDFDILTKGKVSMAIHPSNGVIAPENIFIEEGAVVRHAILNAEDGPIFIAKNALIMEGACLRGPLYIGENATVKMNAAIYGATTVGPKCVVGGEIKNVVFFGNSNKGHEGYLGDAVIGEWCNFGAGTSCSNMKNNIGDIDYYLGDTYFATAQKKAGVMMGDYSRTAINTSINTGTIIGVSAHVFGTGLTPKIIPNFSWGFESELKKSATMEYIKEEMAREKRMKKYELEKALRDANAWKQLKGATLNEDEKNILTELYNKR